MENSKCTRSNDKGGGGGEESIWKGEILHNLRGVVNISYANTSRNQPKCNQSIYDYMRLIVVCD